MSKRRLKQRAISTRHRPLLEPLEGRALPSFLPPVNYPTGQQPNNVATGDFNGDDAVDLAVSNSAFGNGTTIGVRLNNGDGTFGAVKNIGAGTDVYWVIVGEFNNDGKDDLGVVNFGKISILLGNGNGTFQAPKSTTTNLHIVHMDSADLNADGNQDLVVSVAASPPCINVLLGNGNGTFKPFTKFRAGEKPWGVTIDDFDHDNVPDVVVANFMQLNSTISFLRGLGDGKFARPVSYLAFGRTTRHVAAADFNADGHLDIGAANSGNGTISIILGNGDGTFRDPKAHQAGLSASDLAVADFDSDGNLDVATVDYTYPQGNAVVLLGNGDGKLGQFTPYPVGNSPAGVAAADLNGDILPDLAVVNSWSNNMSVLINTPEVPSPLTGPKQPTVVLAGTPLVDFTDTRQRGDHTYADFEQSKETSGQMVQCVESPHAVQSAKHRYTRMTTALSAPGAAAAIEAPGSVAHFFELRW